MANINKLINDKEYMKYFLIYINKQISDSQDVTKKLCSFDLNMHKSEIYDIDFDEKFDPINNKKDQKTKIKDDDTKDDDTKEDNTKYDSDSSESIVTAEDLNNVDDDLLVTVEDLNDVDDDTKYDSDSSDSIITAEDLNEVDDEATLQVKKVTDDSIFYYENIILNILKYITQKYKKLDKIDSIIFAHECYKIDTTYTMLSKKYKSLKTSTDTTIIGFMMNDNCIEYINIERLVRSLHYNKVMLLFNSNMEFKMKYKKFKELYLLNN